MIIKLYTDNDYDRCHEISNGCHEEIWLFQECLDYLKALITLCGIIINGTRTGFSLLPVVLNERPLSPFLFIIGNESNRFKNRLSRRSTPQTGNIKVNTDGSFLSETGRAGIREIARDRNGEMVMHSIPVIYTSVSTWPKHWQQSLVGNGVANKA
ncbi:hypothetical protein HAX54_000221 [Datura stramonium]|uniref:Uncharacterized protein n=1 Tax=Datura stramonium TaxID=4076 RepID=A0ABS8WPR8_DATST|nr:hypothetical protein [Datura stramonium]